MALEYEKAHEMWLASHVKSRSGERKVRLERGHQHGEELFLRQVWWPVVGNLEQLHPEYEVMDWRGRSYFADFAWITGELKVIIEIKGFGPHVRDMDRTRYCQELNRETFLQAMGYRVISFAYDDVADRPELCITLLKMILSRYHVERSNVVATRNEREVIRLAHQLARPLRPKDVESHLDVCHRTSVRVLLALSAKGYLNPIRSESGIRVTKYTLTGKPMGEIIW
ncbi:DUF559 domain-containing protein [Paenibacillus guangzhouensis]|uniref:DUF559 domain-containing protein n=1 Tax=Paenibacillus guangzhouensis TaxID=1473112 RepID=UPI0038991E82